MHSYDKLLLAESATRFARELGQHRSGIVTAEPGSGKTTGIPLAILESDWLTTSSPSTPTPHVHHPTGIILVEPRRVAAAQAARRIAAMLREPLGQTVGLRMRGETVVSSNTRIEVMTEGVLTRMLCSDPGLAGRSVVIFDEFHERSLDSDVALALCLSARELMRPDLRIVVMSATLQAEAIESLLCIDGPVARLVHGGTNFPVEQSFAPETDGDISSKVVAAIGRELQDTKLHESSLAGDVLVFLPGVFEIRRVARLLTTRQGTDISHVNILELHAKADARSVQAALAPTRPGQRRVVLATSLAQTSVTIDGVTVVIDSGLIRKPIRDEATGLSRLATVGISKATATQRAGRAGRTRPGRAVQIWSATQDRAMQPYDLPEICEADLTPIALTAARWGVAPERLRWTDPPLIRRWQSANEELVSLGALKAPSDAGSTLHLTQKGTLMEALPMHPRLAAVLVDAPHQLRTLAVRLVALLSDPPTFLGEVPADVSRRLALLDLSNAGPGVVEPSSRQRFADNIKLIEQVVSNLGLDSAGGANQPHSTSGGLATLLLSAYPERLAVAETSAIHGDRFRFASGLVLPLTTAGDTSLLRGAACLVVVDADSDRESGSIRLAEPITLDALQRWARDTGRAIKTTKLSTWRNGVCRFETVETLSSPEGPLPLGRPTVSTQATGAEYAEAFAHRFRDEAAELSISDSVRHTMNRLALASQWRPDLFPALDLPGAIQAFLTATLPPTPLLSQVPTFEQVNLTKAIEWWVHVHIGGAALDRFVPQSFALSGGRPIAIRYADDGPQASGRVQDFFGCSASPTVADGNVPVVVELLSPAGRVVARTSDLDRFWSVGYPATRSAMRGRYPKHHWPEDPRKL